MESGIWNLDPLGHREQMDVETTVDQTRGGLKQNDFG
jgi:hypothetical protein